MSLLGIINKTKLTYDMESFMKTSKKFHWTTTIANRLGIFFYATNTKTEYLATNIYSTNTITKHSSIMFVYIRTIA